MTLLPRCLGLAETLLKKGKKWLHSPCPSCVPLLETSYQQVRSLNVHEHVSYMLLRDEGIPVPKFFVAKTAEDAVKHAKELNTKDMAIKAQVLAGGRGRGTFKNGFKGGVRMISSPEQAGEYAGKMLNQLLVTKQTGDAGRICKKVMITERKFPRREFYLAIMMERSFHGPVIIASSQGGVSIEDVAKDTPEAIIYEPINLKKGIVDDQVCRVVEKMGLLEHSEEMAKIMKQMYKLFCEKDALLIEINPFAEDVLTSKFYCLDAKFRFDDNAEFRQKKLFSYRDLSQEDPKEIHASKFQLSYISLNGTIGCMVNGAGLAMAVLDIISLKGGAPANFLDVGGGNSAKAVAEAFRMIISDPTVSAIFVNIFGGIMACDVIAEGIINAAKDLKIKVPIVVRLLGAKSAEGQDMIRSSGLSIVSQQDMDKAAEIVVKLAKIVSTAKELGAEEVLFKFPPATGRRSGRKSKSKACRHYSSYTGSKKPPICTDTEKPTVRQKDEPAKKKRGICDDVDQKPDDDDSCGGSLNDKIGMGAKKKPS